MGLRITIRAFSPPNLLPVLQISRRVEYALRAVLRLAGARPNQRLSFKEIAEQEDIPQDYLAKILRSLVERGIVNSRRGANGGYSLAKEPDAISFLEVMEAADSPLAVNLCTPGGDGCTRTIDCAMAAVWTRAENAMRDVLSGTSIAELVGSGSVSLELTDLTRRAAEPLPCQEL